MGLDLVAIVAFGVVGAGLGSVLSHLGRNLIKRADSDTIEVKTPHGRVELQKPEDMPNAEFERQVLKIIHEVESKQDNREANT